MSVKEPISAIPSPWHEAFAQHLQAEFRAYCVSREIIPSAAHLLDYMMKLGLISGDSIRHYTLLTEFAEMSRLGLYSNKTQTVKALAQKYTIHENTVWNVLRGHRDKFDER